MIDTHAHIYAEEFDSDRDEIINNAVQAGVTKIILPAIDRESFASMRQLADAYPDFCLPAIGVHPTSVRENVDQELALVRSELEKGGYIAVGEIGTDLYWEQKYLDLQQQALKTQLEWAIEFNLPVIIHTRNSFKQTMEVFQQFPRNTIKGIFHSFTGSTEEADKILSLGDEIYLGINGIVTFKNSGLTGTLKSIPLERLVLETDAPYLTPVPYRGKRNEPAYLSFISSKLAEVYALETKEIEDITTKNALNIFNIG